MRKLRNFKCSNTGEMFERIVTDDIKSVTCNCEGVAARTLSAPRCFGNTTGGSPGSIYKRK